MTRKETIRAHLESHGYITPGIAMLEYGMTNGLAQRVHDLRRGEDALDIDTVAYTEPVSGRSVCRYELVS